MALLEAQLLEKMEVSGRCMVARHNQILQVIRRRVYCYVDYL